MASNKELTKEALALGKELGVEVSVDGLNNAKLESLVAELRETKDERAKAAPPVTGGAVRKAGGEGSSPPESQPAPAADPAPKGSRVRVAKGRSVTSKRGILGPGTEVRPEFFAGGEEAIKRLLKSGVFERA